MVIEPTIHSRLLNRFSIYLVDYFFRILQLNNQVLENHHINLLLINDLSCVNLAINYRILFQYQLFI